jgi:lipopolysaccharide biosynthesis protein
VWRERVRAAGHEDLYLVRVESWAQDVDPKTIGFDAAAEFAPDWRVLGLPRFHRERWDLVARIQHRLGRVGVIPRVYLDQQVYQYDWLVERMLAKPPASYRRFRCATPGWDNSARRATNAAIFRDSTPRAYEAWLRRLVASTRETFHGDERLVFINAWNEWAEGNHLEPDQRWGRAYLEATARALGTS